MLVKSLQEILDKHPYKLEENLRGRSRRSDASGVSETSTRVSIDVWDTMSVTSVVGMVSGGYVAMAVLFLLLNTVVFKLGKGATAMHTRKRPSNFA